MKAYGKDVKEFFTIGWSPEYYVDDWDEDEYSKFQNMNGDVIVADTEKLDLSKLGTLYLHYREKNEVREVPLKDAIPFEVAFKKWMKTRTDTPESRVGGFINSLHDLIRVHKLTLNGTIEVVLDTGFRKELEF